jgi:hypothetical protein
MILDDAALMLGERCIDDDPDASPLRGDVDPEELGGSADVCCVALRNRQRESPCSNKVMLEKVRMRRWAGERRSPKFIELDIFPSSVGGDERTIADG